MTGDLLSYNGVAIREDSDRLNLTDMWKAAGKPANKRPSEWVRYAGREFIEHMAVVLDMGTAHIVQQSKGGQHGGGGTWAHWQIGLAYAKYLSPAFHQWCNSVVRAHMEGNTAGNGDIPASQVEAIVERTVTTVLDRIGDVIDARLAERGIGGAPKDQVPDLLERRITREECEVWWSLKRTRRWNLPVTARGAAHEGKMAVSTAQQHLRRLVKLGLAEVEHTGTAYRYWEARHPSNVALRHGKELDRMSLYLTDL